MISCIQCDSKPAAACFTLCADCIKAYPHRDNLVQLHAHSREQCGLKGLPPDSENGVQCARCANHCRIGGSRHICWEWNGTADPGLAARAAALSKNTGGTVKFDLKAFDLNLHLALCGTDNRRTLDNFRMLAKQCAGQELVTAATLLVPYYVDAGEVEQLASYIAEVDSNTPYSLLVFHPDFLMDDLPVTPRAQVNDCYEAARMHLKWNASVKTCDVIPHGKRTALTVFFNRNVPSGTPLVQVRDFYTLFVEQ